MQLAQEILSMNVTGGGMGVFFLGQAGFILKSPNGELMGIDLYLSNCCERYFGFKRLMPRLLEPNEITLDYVLASHAHYDHFDPDSIPLLLDHRKTHLFIAKDCVAECVRLGIPESKYSVLTKGKWVKAGDFEILPVSCDHGPETPEALGLYIRCGEKTFYLAGDTCFRKDYAKEMAHMPINFSAAPINGAFGNMNSKEAAAFFQIIKPKLCMPCHYWNFAQHLGDPDAFMKAMDSKNDHPAYILMYPGEFILI